MMNLRRKFLAAPLCGAFLLLGLTSGCDFEDGELLPQDHPVFGKKYEKHTRGWLVWAMEQPYSTGPITDTTGAACANEQSGRVWYLAGSEGGPVERDCDLPAGKALFFPLINRYLVAPESYVEDPESEAGLLAYAEWWFSTSRAATCSLTLTLDGEPYFDSLEDADEALYVVELDPFDLELNDDNFGGGSIPGGYAPFSVTDGHFALLAPLSPGEHTLEFGGALCDADGNVQFETSAVYNLSVADD